METESITRKDTGCEKSLLISYGIHRRRRVCVWSKRWARISAGLRWLLDSRRWRRRRNYHYLMSPIGTAIRRRTTVLSIVNHQLVQYFGLYHICLIHSRTIGFAVLLALRRFYCFINNIAPIPRPINNIIRCTCSLTYGKGRLTGGRLIQGAFDPVFQ